MYLLCAIGATDGNTKRAGSYAQHTTTYIGQVNFMSGNVSTGDGGKNTTGPVSYLTDGYSVSMGGGDFTLNWALKGDSITFQMQAPVTGWISFGFGTSSRMQNSDCYVGWVSNNVVYLLDTWAVGQNQPLLDTQRGGKDDTVLISAVETNGKTVIIFSRKLKTGDSNDLAITNDYMNVLWATSESDGSGGFYSQHSRQGAVKINFITGVSTQVGYKLTPGELLLIIVGVVFGLMIIYHWLSKTTDSKPSNEIGNSASEVKLSVRSFSIST